MWPDLTFPPLLADAIGLPEGHLGEMTLRLLWSCVLGAVLGWDREHHKQSAGLRTHMLVALGTTLFVVVPTEMGATFREVAEMVKGVAAGIGFLGSGAIYRVMTNNVEKGERVHGLTTAASIWLCSAAGVAVGVGAGQIATVAVLLGWAILYLVKKLEKLLAGKFDPPRSGE